MTMKDASMDLENPQWWLLGTTALAAFVGWRSKDAVEAAKRQRLECDMREIKKQLADLQSSNANQDGQIKLDDHRLETIHERVLRLEKRLEKDVEK